MTTPKPATLTAKLLVKKGSAKPSGFDRHSAQSDDVATKQPTEADAAPEAPALSIDPEWLAAIAQVKMQQQRAAKAKDHARLTLRLDPDRHLRLKLTAAHLHLSLQELVTMAVDAYLNDISPDVINGHHTPASAPGLSR